MFDASKCTRCGDCLVRCQYVDYDRWKAIQEMTALIENGDADIPEGMHYLHGLQ
jgi:ferredoxin